MTTWQQLCFNYLDVNNCVINPALFQGFAQMLMRSALIGFQFSLTFPLIGRYFMVSRNWFFLLACNKVDNKPSLSQVNISSHFCSFALPRCCWKVEWIDIDVEYATIKHKNLYGIKPWTFIQPGRWNQPWHWHIGAFLWKAQHSSEWHGQKILMHTDLCTGAVAEWASGYINREEKWWKHLHDGPGLSLGEQEVLDETLTDTAASLPLLWSHKPTL